MKQPITSSSVPGPRPAAGSEKPVKVTVLLVTYNHARYVAQAIESVLSQEADFEYELIISEDCSTDDTRGIITGYQQRHPRKIRLLLSSTNLCSNEVIARGFAAARGEFVAYLDGDDYWTVPHKLQRQVDFMERHPDCALSFHNVLKIHEGQDRASRLSHPVPPASMLTAGDLLATPCINSVSIMFRRTVLPALPSWYYTADLADWALEVLLADRGPVGYIDELMGAYRMHSAGVWAGRSHAERLLQRLEFYRQLGPELRRKYRRAIRVGRARCYYELGLDSESRGDLAGAARHLARSAMQSPLKGVSPGLGRLQLAARIWLPALYRRARALRRRLPGSTRPPAP